MTAHAWLAVAYAVIFFGMALFVLPHWNVERAAEGEAVAENVVIWLHRYRTYRTVVSDEYSRHDGSQRMITNARRYYKPANPAPPAIPAVLENPWWGNFITLPEQPGRHLALASA